MPRRSRLGRVILAVAVVVAASYGGLACRRPDVARELRRELRVRLERVRDFSTR